MRQKFCKWIKTKLEFVTLQTFGHLDSWFEKGQDQDYKNNNRTVKHGGGLLLMFCSKYAWEVGGNMNVKLFN